MFLFPWIIADVCVFLALVCWCLMCVVCFRWLLLFEGNLICCCLTCLGMSLGVLFAGVVCACLFCLAFLGVFKCAVCVFRLCLFVCFV